MSSWFGLSGVIFTVVIVAVSVLLPLVLIWRLRAASMGIAPMQFQPMVVQMQPPQQLPQQLPYQVPNQGPQQIKKATCRECGANKMQPPKTATLYCDYCGAMVDWDFRISVTTAGSARPGPELRRLMAQEKQVQTQAVWAGDRQAYAASLRRVFEQHMRFCSAAYSPRIGDPSYRAAKLEHMVAIDTECGFDPAMRACDEAIEQAQARIQAVRGYGTPARVERHSFAQLVAAKKAATERWMQVTAPHAHLDPDNTAISLAGSIVNSTFVQYWLPFLDQPDQAWLIRELGLEAEYVPVQPVQTAERHCGTCAATLSVVVGARRVVCEHCGFLSDVQQPELPCSGCGAPLSVPVGAAHFACPHCRADMRVDGAAAV